MKRREFITLFGGAVAAWPLVASAQQTKKVSRVGFLWDGPDVFPDALEAFRQGLRDLGYVEGQTIAIEYRWADGKPERMRELGRAYGCGLHVPERSGSIPQIEGDSSSRCVSVDRDGAHHQRWRSANRVCRD